MSNGPINLVLTGFMGTGKSTIGRVVAERLNRPFIDMDEVIVQEAGCPVPEIFARHGESTFRQMERELCQKLSTRSGLVISTGGGALIDAHNRALMTSSAVVICLTANLQALLERLQADTNRPMLNATDTQQRIGELLAIRKAAYDSLPYQIDTSTQTPEETVEAVLALWHKQST
jgi:shikimate kinase